MLIIIIIREANTGEKREREIQDKQIVWEREEVLVLAIIWLMYLIMEAITETCYLHCAQVILIMHLIECMNINFVCHFVLITCICTCM